MRVAPSWARATELADLKIQFSLSSPFVSKRAIPAVLEQESKIVLLKILVGSGRSCGDVSHKTIEQALLRASIIRSQHPAFTHLIDYRWTTFGLVTINEYVPNSFPLSQLRCLHPSRLTNLSLRLCDAISHIHLNASFHGDISLSNAIVNDQGVIYVVDYDLADPVPGFLRTSYDTQKEDWATLGAMQTADIRALERVIINLLSINARRDCHLPDETRNDATRLLRRLKQLTNETSALSRLQRLQAILRRF